MMDSTTNCDGYHLTESEMRQLLAEEIDASIAERANRHLDYCESCQISLENIAANPHEWKQFVAVMDGQLEYPTAIEDHCVAAQPACTAEIFANPGRKTWESPIVLSLAILLFLGLLVCSVADPFDYWKDWSGTKNGPAPTAPTAPDAPGPAPAASK